MAEWWENAPVAQQAPSQAPQGQWWDAAPVHDGNISGMAAVNLDGFNPEPLPAAVGDMRAGFARNLGPGLVGLAGVGAKSIADGLPFADRLSAARETLMPGGGSYADNLARERNAEAEIAKNYPVTSAIGGMAGGALVPVGAVGAAAKSAGLAARAFRGMLAGGGIGSVEGLSASPDLTDLGATAKSTGQGAAGGAAVGLSIPILARGIGAAYNTFAGRAAPTIDGLSSAAQRKVMGALQADDVARVQAEAARLGPDAVLADTGPSMLGLAQGVGARPGEGRTILTDALRARNEGTNARVYGDVNAALGPAEDAQAVTNAIVNRRSQVDAINYGKALDNAPAVDTTALLANLGKAIDQSEGMEKKALISARDYLMTQKQAAVLTKSGAPMYDPVTGEIVTELRAAPKDAAINLHKIKGELDNVIQYGAPGLGVPAGALERQQGALKTIRGQLNDALEQQVPGYAEANAQSAALARRAEAVQAGTGILDSGKTAPSPGRFAEDFGAMVPGEQIAFNKGARAEIDRQLGTKVNDLVALKGALQGEGGWNTAKIGTAFGDDAANALVASVDRNTKFRDTFNKVVENSQTAQRSQAAKALEDDNPVKLTSDTLYGDAKRLLLKPANAVLQAMLERNNAPRDAEIARFLSAGGPERDRNLSALVDAISRTQQLKQSADAKGSIAAVAAALAARAGLDDRRRAQ